MGLFKKKISEVSIIPQPAAAQTAGIPAEVVAAIAGAVAFICGEEAKVTAIRPAARRVSGLGRSTWSLAGLLDNTRPF